MHAELLETGARVSDFLPQRRFKGPARAFARRLLNPCAILCQIWAIETTSFIYHLCTFGILDFWLMEIVSPWLLSAWCAPYDWPIPWPCSWPPPACHGRAICGHPDYCSLNSSPWWTFWGVYHLSTPSGHQDMDSGNMLRVGKNFESTHRDRFISLSPFHFRFVSNFAYRYMHGGSTKKWNKARWIV